MNSQENMFEAKISQLEIMREQMNSKKTRHSLNHSNSIINTNNVSADEITNDIFNTLSIADLKERRRSILKPRDRVSSYSIDKDLYQNVDNLVAEWKQHKGLQPPNRVSIPDLNLQGQYQKSGTWEPPEFTDHVTPGPMSLLMIKEKNYITDIYDEDLLSQGDDFDEPMLTSLRKSMKPRAPLLSARNSYNEKMSPLVKQFSEAKLQPFPQKLAGLLGNMKNPKIANKMSSSSYMKTDQSVIVKQKIIKENTPIMKSSLQNKPLNTSKFQSQVEQSKSQLKGKLVPTSQQIQPQLKQQIQVAKKLDPKLLKNPKDSIIKVQEYNILVAQINKLKKDVQSFYDKNLKTKKDNVNQLQLQLKNIQDLIKQDIEDN